MSESNTLVPDGSADPPSRFAQGCEWALIPKHPSPGPLAFAIAQTLAQTHWCLVCLENWYLGGRSQTPSAWHVRGTPMASPPPKPPKTNEKSMIRALELPGASPERPGAAQSHPKAPKSHPRAAQERPGPSVRPTELLFRPTRLLFRPTGLLFQPTGLLFRPTKLLFRPIELLLLA